MSVDDDLAYASATDLAAAVRTREISPVEIVGYFLERIEQRNPSLNAFVFLAADDAREAARRAEKAVLDGEELGPLHGVPTALKDLFDFHPGWPSTFGGIPALRENIAQHHCTYAERMKAAGAILLGKTNSPVMGFRGTCDNPLFGATRNPFDTSRNSGGSSGGSAAAVADGLLPLAEGTDGGGSIRIPASWCGVVGYKASFGRVPFVARPNAFGGISPFLFEGVIGRSVADVALGASVLTGYDPRDPFALDETVDYAGACERSLTGTRIAYSPDFGMYPVDPKVAAVTAQAAAAFREAGATVDEIDMTMPYGQQELAELWCRMMAGVEVIELFKAQGLDLLADGDLPPEYRSYVEANYRRSALEVLRDQQMRSEVYDAVQGVFGDYDLLLTPTLACLPVPNADGGATAGPTRINDVEVNPLIGWCMTYPINYTGHPAVSVPAGMAEGDLPVGLQIIGRRYDDPGVIAAAAALERVRPWRHTYARCADRSL
ncbi:amidase [Pseudonocardia acidicola]|uniref:Amidase n=1 Tax=Pseudonocardia acidicola TaxID=2724939 RepID=A0ABX1S5A1_9PSEU|nr:amidase [Pseudonocardia acidicola]NMH95742.1 amidase [Pseudonocardia acidicola]